MSGYASSEHNENSGPSGLDNRVHFTLGKLFDEKGLNANSVELEIFMSTKGPRPGTPSTTVQMGLISVNDSWKYLSHHSVAMKIDEQRIDLGDSVDFKSDLFETGGCYEAAWVTVLVGDAEKIANAQDVKVAYSINEFVLSPEQRQKVGEAVRLAKDPKLLEDILAKQEEVASKAKTEAEEHDRRMDIAVAYERAYDRVVAQARGKRDSNRILKLGHNRIVKEMEEKHGVTEDELREWVLEYRKRGR